MRSDEVSMLLVVDTGNAQSISYPHLSLQSNNEKILEGPGKIVCDAVETTYTTRNVSCYFKAEQRSASATARSLSILLAVFAYVLMIIS